MSSQVVVWNSDARYRPELEVEIEILEATTAIPGFYRARRSAELEVEITIVEEFDELADDDLVALDDYTVYDTPPRGYADAFAMAI